MPVTIFDGFGPIWSTSVGPIEKEIQNGTVSGQGASNGALFMKIGLVVSEHGRASQIGRNCFGLLWISNRL